MLKEIPTKYVHPIFWRDPEKDLVPIHDWEGGWNGAIYKASNSGANNERNEHRWQNEVCNMAVEMGAKNGIVEPDETTSKFLESRVPKSKLQDYQWIERPDTKYEKTIDIEVSDLEPQIACPSSVDNVKAFGAV